MRVKLLQAHQRGFEPRFIPQARCTAVQRKRSVSKCERIALIGRTGRLTQRERAEYSCSG